MIRRPPRSTLFPTRRSSDLPLDAVTVQQGQEDVAQVGTGRQRAVAEEHRPVEANQPKLRARGQQAGQDRKSTRLNSSHANISYAVFCLKKTNVHSPTPTPAE